MLILINIISSYKYILLSRGIFWMPRGGTSRRSWLL